MNPATMLEFAHGNGILGTFMKTLDTDIKKSGFAHRQLWRDGRVAVYRKTHPDHERESFEVILIRSHKGFSVAGQAFPPAETYPASEQWGTSGWTYLTRAEAEAKANSLLHTSGNA